MGLTTGSSVVLTGLAIELDVANPKSYAVFGGVKGYSLGGTNNLTNYATAEKITYSSDTSAAQTSANLSAAKQSATGCSEGSAWGYTLGGYVIGSSAYTTTTDKTIYATDITTTSTSADSSVARGYQASVSTYNNKGYICGGFSGSSVPLTTVDFITYSLDITVAQTTTALTAARAGAAGLSLPNMKGYVCGGSTGGGTTFYATTEKITFSTDTLVAQTTANLSQSRGSSGGISECSTKGYVAGGFTVNTGAVVTTADKITFSTDTTAAQTTANLSTARSDMGCPSQGSSKGYFLGGFTNASSTVGTTTSDKITFATDTTAAQASANISVARGLASSLDNIYAQTINDISGNINAGTISNFASYSMDNGGCLVFNGNVNYQNTITIPANSSYAFGTGDFAYEIWFYPFNFASGNNYLVDLGSNAGNLQYYLNRLSYYNTSTGGSGNLALKGPALVPNNWYHVTISRVSGTTYMYLNGNLITSQSDGFNFSSPSITLGNYGGGGAYGFVGKIGLFRLYSSKGLSAVEVLQNYNATKNRFAVPNSVMDSSLLMNLDASNRISFARYGGTKGYIIGGYTGALVVTGDKLTYATDTTSASTASNSSIARSGISRHGISEGATKGFISGGYTGGTTSTLVTDKITYSTDVNAAQTSSNLVYARYDGAAFSDFTTKGYLLGGNNETNAAYAQGQKITFAAETFSNIVPASLASVKQGHGSISDGVSKAITAGGSTAGYTVTAMVTSCEKTDFATDQTSSVSMTLSTPVGYFSTLTDYQAKAFFIGGYRYLNSTSSIISSSDSLSFATNSISSFASATLSTGRWAATNLDQITTNGYILGGYTNTGATGYASVTEKFNYTTTTFSNATSANLSQTRGSAASVGPAFDTTTTNTFYDTTTSNDTATLVNGPTYSLTDPAIIFDGTNDYGSYTATALLNPGTALTIAGFVKISNLAQAVGTIFNANDVAYLSQTKGYKFYFRPTSEYAMGAYSMRLQFGMTAWAWNIYASEANAIIDTGWHHVAVTASALNTASPTINFYVDGRKLNNNFWNAGSKAAINYATDANSLRLASTYFPGFPAYEENYLNGSIANLKVFNRSLNDLEILQDYQFYINKLGFLTLNIGTTKNNPAPSGYAIKQIRSSAQTGWYWLNVNGVTSQFWVDMDYDGGGWVMVINNRAGNGAMANLTYFNATKTNINARGSYGLNNNPSNFNLWVGLNAWKTIADETSGSNTVVMFVATSYRTLSDINNHTKRARFTWTGWSATYAWQGAASYVNERGTTTAGLWAYHIANGYSLSAFDLDQDAWGNNCSTYYGNSPWWFGACWDGFYFPNGGGYGDFINWAGAGSDLHNYGAIYVR